MGGNHWKKQWKVSESGEESAQLGWIMTTGFGRGSRRSNHAVARGSSVQPGGQGVCRNRRLPVSAPSAPLYRSPLCSLLAANDASSAVSDELSCVRSASELTMRIARAPSPAAVADEAVLTRRRALG